MKKDPKENGEGHIVIKMGSKTNLGMIVNFFFLFLLAYFTYLKDAYIVFLLFFGIIVANIIGLDKIKFEEEWD